MVLFYLIRQGSPNVHSYLHFAYEVIEAPRGKVVCPGSPSYSVRVEDWAQEHGAPKPPVFPQAWPCYRWRAQNSLFYLMAAPGRVQKPELISCSAMQISEWRRETEQASEDQGSDPTSAKDVSSRGLTQLLRAGLGCGDCSEPALLL